MSDLRKYQYKDSSNLRARASLHSRFGTNRSPWYRWVFENLAIAEMDRVLEIGCGPGTLWAQNLDRLPTLASYQLSDFSEGMVSEARANLKQQSRFRFVVCEAGAIPFPDAIFDVVVANHMLYHVPDIPRALSEIRRVLKPGERFYATTNGVDHMRELADVLGDFDPALILAWRKRSSTTSFNLENGAALLAESFVDIEVARYPDSLAVTDAGPLVAYVLSMGSMTAALQGREEEFHRFIEGRFQRSGVLRISTDAGIFSAVRT